MSPLANSRVFQGCRALFAAAAKTAAHKSAATAAATAAKATSAKPRESGILKPVPVSPALRKFLGVSEVARSTAVKKIWEYIKLHNLQNPANKREIYCDEKLKAIFERKDKIGMLEIPKLLNAHFVKAI